MRMMCTHTRRLISSSLESSKTFVSSASMMTLPSLFLKMS